MKNKNNKGLRSIKGFKSVEGIEEFGKLEELPEKDLLELTILYTCRNKKSWRFIDNLYNKYYDECIEVSEEAKLRFKNIIKERESIETKCYISKISALMVLDEQNGTQDNIVYILKNIYRKIYNYVVSVDKVKVSKYWLKHLRNSNSATNTCSEITVLIFMASFLGKEVDKTEGAYSLVATMFPHINSGKIQEDIVPGAKYRECNKEMKLLVDKIESLIRNKRFVKGYNFDQMLIFPNNKSDLKDNVYDRLSSMSILSLTSDALNIGSLLNNIEVGRETVKDIIANYLTVYTSFDDNVLEVENIDMDELISFLYINMMQAMFIKLYNRTEEFFFDNYNENSITRQKILIEENRELKKKNLLLTDKNDQLQREIEELKRQLNKANKELEVSSSNNKELFELRNYIFNNQEVEEFNDVQEDYKLDYLDGKKVVCFGGTSSWISNMTNEFKWSFIPASNINFDTSILKDVDIIIIKATYISHGMYYKIISNMCESASIKFINGSNINKIKYELSKYSN
ncbi:MAG: hypothetical protein IJ086_15340 [Clostridium sp.]|nr:hypothetical protein [Clostridium sp.]MBQ9000050.1 hypothetical protein [Clostridium sp.]